MTNSEIATATSSFGRAKVNLFLASLLLLFLELACIRWFPAHVLFLTFFTNTVLLASFLGMSVGCLCASSRRDFLKWTPSLLGIALLSALGVEYLMNKGGDRFMDVGSQTSPQMVYFGTEYHTEDLATFRIPVEVVNGFFFLIVAVTFVGPGQLLGRCLSQVPDRIRSYTINILGSIAGIVLFAGFSALYLSPFWWFVPVSVVLAYFLVSRPPRGFAVAGWISLPFLLVLLPSIAAFNFGVNVLDRDGNRIAQCETYWSPYYRIDYKAEPVRDIEVNLIGHQNMISIDAPAQAYALPHLLNRDSSGSSFENVLIIGAGSGNDVSRALQWGAKHVDAVEIDPVIYRLGKQHHPNHPYDDPRVTVHLDDGRNFLRSADKKYDLVIYALVDSLVLHSSFSNIRLESYLFTRQAFQDVQRCLKPTGMFVVYNFFRQGWIVARLHNGLEEIFNTKPLVFGLPAQAEIGPEDNLGQSFTMFMVGDTDRIRVAFSKRSDYWLKKVSPDPDSTPNGFAVTPATGEESRWSRYTPAKVSQPVESLRTTDDNWPFLYLRTPMVPNLTLRGVLIMGGLALVLLYAIGIRGSTASEGVANPALNFRMFFLGAAFMLVETKAVVHMALLFGSTWIVNSVVFFAVLAMILFANLCVSCCRPKKLTPYYIGLLISLAVNVLVPLDFFLGMSRVPQIGLSCLLLFAPILFAGVIFAVSFSHAEQPDRAFGFNVAGAMLGGLTENASMLVGFQYLVLIAAGFYVLSLLVGLLRTSLLPSTSESVDAVPPSTQASTGGVVLSS